MEMMRQFNWHNEATALRYTDATKERGRKIAGYFNQVTPPKKKSREDDPVPGLLGAAPVAGPSQAVEEEVYQVSPEKEKEVVPISPEKEKRPNEEGGEMNEENEDAFLYASASAFEEEKAVARKADGGETVSYTHLTLPTNREV